MKQVIQNFKTGVLSIEDLPAPGLSSGFVLVRNEFSLISAGTERSTVNTAQASLLNKARQRPDLVRQVLETFRREGLTETWRRVRTKLETLKELGYSSAGTVLASLDTQGRFKPGDRVACGGGGYASHAGIVSVPQNLVVKVPASVGPDAAAFTTLGAIAMQGVRQADPKIGDLVCVIGLGLLGQLTAQILRANGCQVFGIDTSEGMVNLAGQLGWGQASVRSNPGLESAMGDFTEGRGFDLVIITAAAQSDDPIQLATTVLRQKGVVVVVGAVPMNVPREPHFYTKELSLKISCSYGPGRYDPSYEEGGQDYPYGYVRWTENRNMAAFVGLLGSRSIDVKPLVTHVFDIEKAEAAYEIVTGKTKERHLAILLRYPLADEVGCRPPPVPAAAPAAGAAALGIGFIGAGSFAQKFLLPFSRSAGDFIAVATARGVTAKNVGEKFGFRSYSTDPSDVIGNPAINTVFIATRHNTHAEFAAAALAAGKNVFVEKPLALLEEDLKRVLEAARTNPRARLMVGFNRRFAPLSVHARKFFEAFSEPIVVNYRVNAGPIPPNHWIQTEEGGGRILGEVCHFVDLIQYLTASEPETVTALSVSDSNVKVPDFDNAAVTIRFANGSVGHITYVASGDRGQSKERIEIFGAGRSMVIDDFRSGECFAGGRREVVKLPGKGHKEEVDAFLLSIREGSASPIALPSLTATTVATFRILDALRTGLPQSLPGP